MYYFLYDNHNSRNQAILSHNEYDRDVCDNCGAIHITYKGIFNFRIMGKLLDYYFVSSTPVISERFLNVLREYGFTGYDVSETTPYHGTVKMVGDPIKEKYYRLKVTGRCGLMCDMSGEPFPYCRKCGMRFPFCGYISNGVSFDSASYDESDIFAFENMSNIPIVSEAVSGLRPIFLFARTPHFSGSRIGESYTATPIFIYELFDIFNHVPLKRS